MRVNTEDAAAVEAAALSGEPLQNSVALWGDDKTCLTAHPDFKMRRIATRGTGNGGRWVLVGLTPRGRAICREGRVARLIREGVPADVAQAAAGMPYGAEPEVARLAADLVRVAHVATRPTGRRDWERIVGAPVPDGQSMPRAWAAWDIAAAVVAGAWVGGAR